MSVTTLAKCTFFHLRCSWQCPCVGPTELEMWTLIWMAIMYQISPLGSGMLPVSENLHPSVTFMRHSRALTTSCVIQELWELWPHLGFLIWIPSNMIFFSWYAPHFSDKICSALQLHRGFEWVEWWLPEHFRLCDGYQCELVSNVVYCIIFVTVLILWLNQGFSNCVCVLFFSFPFLFFTGWYRSFLLFAMCIVSIKGVLSIHCCL